MGAEENGVKSELKKEKKSFKDRKENGGNG